MSNADAIRTLQHASDYIFVSRIASVPRNRMRRSADVWQAMATLHECRNSLRINLQADSAAGYRMASKRPTLVCGLHI
jgi:hypothetical protein